MSSLQCGDIIICMNHNGSNHALLYIGVQSGYYSCIDCVNGGVRQIKTKDHKIFINTGNGNNGYTDIYALRLVQQFSGDYVVIDGEKYDNYGDTPYTLGPHPTEPPAGGAIQ